MQLMKKNWSLKLNNKKIKPILFIIFSIILTLLFGIIRLWIILARPDITYRGSKIVPQGDIIYLNKINLRYLHQDIIYKNSNTCWKHYIIKKNHLSKENLKNQLFDYCKAYYESNKNYNEIVFYFYQESPTIPWFWNNSGYFPDLEMNSEYCIFAFYVNNDGIKISD